MSNELCLISTSEGTLVAKTDLPVEHLKPREIRVAIRMLGLALHPKDVEKLECRVDGDTHSVTVMLELNPHLVNIGEIVGTIHAILSTLGVGPIDCSGLKRVH